MRTIHIITAAKPIPPSRMRIAIIARPNRLNVAATSTVTKPVTHTALTEVNRASIYVRWTPERWANGNVRNKEPSRIMTKKPVIRY
jgi:hypothetical protein